MNNVRSDEKISTLLMLYMHSVWFLYFFVLSFPSLCLCVSGVVSLSQALCSTDEYSNSLLHLDLSKNPGVLSGDDASVRQHDPSGNENTLLHVILFVPLASLL